MNSKESHTSQKVFLVYKIHRFFLRYFLLCALVLSVLITLGGYYFLVSPERSRFLNKQAEETERLQAKIREQEVEFESLKVTLQMYDILARQNIHSMERIIPPFSHKDETILVLNNLLQSQNLHLTTFDLGAPIRAGLYFKDGAPEINVPVVGAPVRFTMEGARVSDEGAKELLYLLYNTYRIFDVESATLHQIGKEGDGNFEVAMNIFFWDDTEEEVQPDASQ